MAKRVFSARRQVEFRVKFTIPEGARVVDCREYIRDAVSSWKGSLRPPGGHGDNDTGDPMYWLDESTIKVSRVELPRNIFYKDSKKAAARKT